MLIVQEFKSDHPYSQNPPFLKRVHYQFRRGPHFWILFLPVSVATEDRVFTLIGFSRSGPPISNEAVTLACSMAPPPPQYYDPRMTTSSDAKG